MDDKDDGEVDEVDQNEREETEADSLPEALLEKHGHVDAVGRETDEVDGRDEDGGLDSVEDVLVFYSSSILSYSKS